MAAGYPYLSDYTTSSKYEKLIKVFVIFVIICLAGELIWLLGVSPLRPFSRIDISGMEGGRDEILAAAGITSYSSFVSTDAMAAENALLNLSAIKSARVFKRFPDRLQIVLEGRVQAAWSLATLGGKTVPVQFDSQGVIFKIGGEENEFLNGYLPLISGLVIDEPFPGMRLPVLFIPLFVELEKIKSSAPELLGAVSEIRINRKLFDGFDLVLFPVHKKVRVRLSELNEELLRYTLLMVDVLSSRESGIDSFDFRSGVASYIPKEASSE